MPRMVPLVPLSLFPLVLTLVLLTSSGGVKSQLVVLVFVSQVCKIPSLSLLPVEGSDKDESLGDSVLVGTLFCTVREFVTVG